MRLYLKSVFVMYVLVFVMFATKLCTTKTTKW